MNRTQGQTAAAFGVAFVSWHVPISPGSWEALVSLWVPFGAGGRAGAAQSPAALLLGPAAHPRKLLVRSPAIFRSFAQNKNQRESEETWLLSAT